MLGGLVPVRIEPEDRGSVRRHGPESAASHWLRLTSCSLRGDFVIFLVNEQRTRGRASRDRHPAAEICSSCLLWEHGKCYTTTGS